MAAWLGTGTSIGESERAALAWRRIQHKPLSIVLKTATGANRAAQIVRVESDTSASLSTSTAGAGATRRVIVFGIRNHPILVDTEMAEGDRFVYLDDVYTCVDTIVTLGEIQGVFESVG